MKPTSAMKPISALVDPGPMRLRAEQAAEALSLPGTFVWLSGGQGAGRDVVLDALQSRFQDKLAVVRVAPLSSPDAVAHARLQLAVLARQGTTPLNLLVGSTHAALISNLSLLKESERILVLRMHPTWEVETSTAEQTIAERAANFLRELGAALKDVPLLRVLVLASSHRRGALRDLGQRANQEIALAIPQLAAGALEDEERWRTLRDNFRGIRDGLAGNRPTPLQLRLGVALVALGDSLSEVIQLLRSLVTQDQALLEPLIKRLRPLLAGHASAPILRRAAFARFSLPWDKLLTAVPDLEPVADLVRIGLGYETRDGRVRLSEPVRRALLSDNGGRERLAEPDLETHSRLERTWEQLDGALSPEMLQPAKVIPWLEKMHHRAHAGAQSREQLEQLDLPAPEFYWDLGRALSREQERFEDAAVVYRRCWEKFNHDDYAHHYYAWNLDRAARKPAEVEAHYRRAIHERPDNVWWHARLCTFLIHRARFHNAEEAFRQALRTLDPEEVEVRRDARFSRSLHRWVVEAWLGMGEVERAREVLALVPNEVVQTSDVLRALAVRVVDAVEATELGESVYPASLPLEDRWIQPAFIPDEEDGRPLVVWRPGRVRQVRAEGIELVYAESHATSDSRELHGLEFSRAEWHEYARGKQPQVDAFVIFAEYEGGLKRLFHWPARSPSANSPAVDEEFDSLRYVREWLGTVEASST
jgi:tetratricopeptide (TPR) repeat protein